MKKYGDDYKHLITHVDQDTYRAVKNLAWACDESVSKWLKRVVKEAINDSKKTYEVIP